MLQNPLLNIPNLNSPNNDGTNVGGILDRIQLIPVSQIQFLKSPDANGYLPLTFMIIDNNRSIINIELAVDSGLFSETLSISENGNFWNQEVSFDLAKNKPAMAQWISQNSEVEFIGFVTTKNRQGYLLGDVATPLKFMEDIHTPGGRAGQNKRSWKLTAMVEHPAYFLRGDYKDLIQTLGTDGDVWVTFPRTPFSGAFDPKYYGIKIN